MRTTLQVSMLLVALCGSLVADAQPSTLRRLPADSIWRRVWTIGGDTVAETFIEPRQIVVTGDLVVVLDEGSREVHALDARTGASRFVLKAKGQGPGEFRRPGYLAATPSGFGVLDHANARFTVYDRKGRLLWNAVLDDVFAFDGMCVRANSHIVATKKSRDTSVVEFDSTGKRVAARSVPWVEMVRGGFGFAYAHYTSSAAPNGDCVLAPIFGAEWAVLTSQGPLRAFRLREPGAQPVITVTERVLDRTASKVVMRSPQTSDTKHATRGAMVIGDTAVLNAAHTREARLKWLDYYLLRNGAYVYSRRLPFDINAGAMGADGTLYVTHIGSTSSWVAALRPATVTDAKKTK